MEPQTFHISLDVILAQSKDALRAILNTIVLCRMNHVPMNSYSLESINMTIMQCNEPYKEQIESKLEEILAVLEKHEHSTVILTFYQTQKKKNWLVQKQEHSANVWEKWVIKSCLFTPETDADNTRFIKKFNQRLRVIMHEGILKTCCINEMHVPKGKSSFSLELARRSVNWSDSLTQIITDYIPNIL